MSRAEREQRVSAAFVALADTLVDDYDVIDLLDRLVGHCVDLLAASAAGLLLDDGRGALYLAAASDEDAARMESLQVRAGEGPCLEAWDTLAQVRVPDLAQAADRWPAFVAAATRADVFASVHAIPLRLRGQAIGALNLFHRAPGALPEDDLELAQALADVATIGILQHRALRRGEVVTEQLRTALDSRVVLEQAKGIVSQRLGVGMDVAFQLLRRQARSTNQRLADVARQVVSRELDPAALSARGASAPARGRGRPGADDGPRTTRVADPG